MKIEEMLNKLVYGKKLRRQSWNDNLWIDSNGTTVRLYNQEPEGKRLIDTDVRFTLDDLMAEDWETC